MRKILLPNGKLYTKNQLYKLNMKQVFDILMDLDIADNQLYQDFTYLFRKEKINKSKPPVRLYYNSPPRTPGWPDNL